MGIVKSVYKLFGVNHLDKHERLVIRDGDMVRFKCTHCVGGITETITRGQKTNEVFPLFCKSCGHMSKYMIAGDSIPYGMISTLSKEVYYCYQIQSDGSKKFIGGTVYH